MSQEDTVLRMLREAGSRGVHTFELRAAFIGNPSERIARLERRGYRIRVSDRERLNGRAVGVRYFLERDAGTISPPAGGLQLGGPASQPAPVDDALFDAGAFAERGGYRDSEAA